MKCKIKFKGMFGSKYDIREWDFEDLDSINIWNKINTKKGLLTYMLDIRIHEDSVEPFLKLIKEWKKKNLIIKNEYNKKRKKLKKQLEKYLK